VAGPALDALVRETARQARFCRLLNWMLFCAYPPDRRFHVLERFYRLPEATIRRFYALELTLGDRARLLVGRPPAGLSLRAAFSRWQAA
jgi:lycopene beta-cyclase